MKRALIGGFLSLPGAIWGLAVLLALGLWIMAVESFRKDGGT